MSGQIKFFNVEYHLKALAPKPFDVRFWIVKPQKLPGQELIEIQQINKPSLIYRDGQGNVINYHHFHDKKIITHNVCWKLALQPRVRRLGKGLNHGKVPGSLRRYLQSEPFLEQTKAVKLLTREVTKTVDNKVKKIEKIFRFVVASFKYRYPVPNRGVKNLDLNAPCGDCAEYSGLLVTMCRIIGVPAVNWTGFVIYPGTKKMVEHGWASVYLPSFGWLDIDPQFAALEKRIDVGLEKYFYRCEDYRLAFVRGFNIPLRPAVPSKFSFQYWNKHGLPMTSRSVQTIQPAVYVADGLVQFNARIRLIRNAPVR